MTRKKFLLVALIVTIATFTSACATVESPLPLDESLEQVNQSEISVSQARDIAIAAVGGGDVVSLSVEAESDDMQFHISVMYNDNLYEVALNAQTGRLMRIRSNYTLGEQIDESALFSDADQPEAIYAVNRTVSATTPTAGDPISRERAIELAREHLNSIGRGNAVFRYAYADIDDGRPVWSVEFAGGLEFYVCRNTGEFFKSPSAGATTVASPGGGIPSTPGGGSAPPSPGGGNHHSTPGDGSSPSPGGDHHSTPGGGSSPSPGGNHHSTPGGGWSSPSPPPGEGPGWHWDGSWTHTWTHTWTNSW